MSGVNRSAEERPQRRADARRNIEAIVDAAEQCLARDPDASMGDIAAQARLGRVTVYGHFKSRGDLVEVVVRRALDTANEALGAVDLSGNAAAALERLIDATWAVTARTGSVLVAAEKALPPTVVRDLHGGDLEDRVRELIDRGQRSGEFQADLPVDWLVALMHAVIHQAAHEVAVRHIHTGDAPRLIKRTMLGAVGARRRYRSTRGV